MSYILDVIITCDIVLMCPDPAGREKNGRVSQRIWRKPRGC